MNVVICDDGIWCKDTWKQIRSISTLCMLLPVLWFTFSKRASILSFRVFMIFLQGAWKGGLIQGGCMPSTYAACSDLANSGETCDNAYGDER